MQLDEEEGDDESGINGESFAITKNLYHSYKVKDSPLNFLQKYADPTDDVALAIDIPDPQCPENLNQMYNTAGAGGKSAEVPKVQKTSTTLV